MKLAIEIWQKTLLNLKKHKVLLFPFVITAAFLFVALYILYLAPSKPVSIFLAPLIRAFYGEKFLHYPASVFLLPKLFYYAQLALSATIGVIMSGAAIGMLRNINSKLAVKGLVNLVDAIRKYFILLGIWIVMFGVSFLLEKLALKGFSSFQHHLLTALVTYLITMAVQVIFIYSMPIVIIKGKGFLGALGEGVLFFKKFFLTSIVLVMIPSLLSCPIVMLNHYLPKLIKKFSPEVVIVYLFLGILVTFIMDVLITCSATMLLLSKDSNKASKI